MGIKRAAQGRTNAGHGHDFLQERKKKRFTLDLTTSSYLSVAELHMDSSLKKDWGVSLIAVCYVGKRRSCSSYAQSTSKLPLVTTNSIIYDDQLAMSCDLTKEAKER